MQKSFFCLVNGRDVTVTKADAAIMMEKSALDEIGKILVSNTRGQQMTVQTNLLQSEDKQHCLLPATPPVEQQGLTPSMVRPETTMTIQQTGPSL
jgi:hypothetical protein